MSPIQSMARAAVAVDDLAKDPGRLGEWVGAMRGCQSFYLEAACKYDSLVTPSTHCPRFPLVNELDFLRRGMSGFGSKLLHKNRIRGLSRTRKAVAYIARSLGAMPVITSSPTILL